jgi:hypothetical protein
MAMIDWEDRNDAVRTLPYAKIGRFCLRRDWAEGLLACGALCFVAREWINWARSLMNWF